MDALLNTFTALIVYAILRVRDIISSGPFRASLIIAVIFGVISLVEWVREREHSTASN